MTETGAVSNYGARDGPLSVTDKMDLLSQKDESRLDCLRHRRELRTEEDSGAKTYA